jgi:molybdate transport system ATP-binding protein
MLNLDIQKELEGFRLDLRLDAPSGKIIVLFGASGAGKSLTLASIAGLLTPDAGRIQIGERVLFDATQGINLSPQARKIGMVRQDLTLFPHLSAADNVAYGLKGSRHDKERRVRELLELVHLETMGKRKPEGMSGGQQQRIALARALAIEPTLLLLDEPFSALDLTTRVELRRELQQLQQQLKTSMFFVTHDLGEAALLGDEMAVIDNGRILQMAPPNQILQAPLNARVAQIVGVKNILPATIIGENAIRIGERELQADTSRFARGAEVKACIRAERVLLVRPEGPTRMHTNPIEGMVLEQESDGNDVMLRFRADEARLQPASEFDLHIDMPVYVYERLQIAREKHWLVTLKPSVLHLVRE